MALIVEVVDSRGGSVKERVRLDGGSLNVGRGYDNDLILDDLYVDARHARIDVNADGSVEIEDLGSINGLVALDTPGRVPRVIARPGTQVRIGRTILRFRDPSEPVPPALQERTKPAGISRLFDNGGLRAAAFIAALTMATAYTWFGSYERDSGSTAVAVAVVFVLFAVMWAGIWAVASRIVINRFNFTSHLAAVAVVAIPVMLFTSIDAWATFLFPDNPLWVPFGMVVWSGLFMLSIALHLSLSSTMDRLRRWRAAVMTTGAFALMMGLLAYAGRDAFTDVPEFQGVIKPFSGQMLPAIDVSGFSDVLAELKEEADELATDR
ncbi:MAG: FHA domain-containing protein [Gemmatimonadetes bacterium]|nr:FHA domain-containing protein [Gemmatimonadota bacterium]